MFLYIPKINTQHWHVNIHVSMCMCVFCVLRSFLKGNWGVGMSRYFSQISIIQLNSSGGFFRAQSLMTAVPQAPTTRRNGWNTQPQKRFRNFCRIVPRTHLGRSAFDISGDVRSIIDEGSPPKRFSCRISNRFEIVSNEFQFDACAF